jgi:hypothetical protein
MLTANVINNLITLGIYITDDKKNNGCNIFLVTWSYSNISIKIMIFDEDLISGVI